MTLPVQWRLWWVADVGTLNNPLKHVPGSMETV